MSEHQIHIRSEHHDDEVVIAVSGDVDLRTAPRLRQVIEQEGLSGPGTRVVIDLRDVRFMDSPGLGTLIFCHRAMEAAGSHLSVRHAEGDVRDLLVLTHAERLLQEPAD